MVSGKESDMKLSPEELRGKEEAVASMEHGKKPVFKEQGNREAAAESDIKHSGHELCMCESIYSSQQTCVADHLTH